MTDRTPLERVLAAFDHEETGYVPLWAILVNRPIYEHVLGKGNVPTARAVPLEEKLAAHARVYRELGIDLTRCQQWPPDDETADTGGTHWAERPATAETIADLSPSFPDAAAREEESRVWSLQIAANAPRTVFAPTIHGPFCRTFELLGLEEFSYAVADSPAEIERLLEAFTEYNRDRAERLAAKPDVRVAAICDDMAYKGGTMAAPEWMRRHWIPKLARIVEPLKRAGKKVVYHSDGKMDALIPDLIEIGVDGINPLEPLAGMDLAELKRDFGRDVTLIGGVDCSQLLPFGPVSKIRDEVKRLLDIGSPGGGFVIGDSSQVVPTTPVEHILAFYETVREYNGGR